MKKVKGKVDLSAWGLDAVDSLEDAVNVAAKKAAAEVLELLLDDDDNSEIWFPITYGIGRNGGLCHKDKPRYGATTIFLRFQIGEFDGEGPTYSYDIASSIRNDIDSGIDEQYQVDGYRALQRGLLEIVEMIDKAIIDSGVEG